MVVASPETDHLPTSVADPIAPAGAAIRTKRARRTSVVIALLVGLVAAVVYAGSLKNGFVFDDVEIVVQRVDLHSLGNWQHIITSPWWPHALYRPLTQLSLAVDWTLSGGSPVLFHGVNIALHAITTILVFTMATLWLSTAGACVAAVLFAVHPVHVEAVASVVGRAEVLVALFTVLAALAYRWDGRLASRGDQSWRRYCATLGTLVALLLGVASKENALAIPGVLLIVDWVEAQAHGESFDRRIRRHWILWAASVALALEWLLLRSALLGDVAGDDPAPGLLGIGIIGRTVIMAPIVLHYVRLFVFPLRLSLDYSPNFVSVEPTVTAPALLGFGVLITVAVAAALARRRFPVVTFGLAWTAGCIFVVSNIVLPTGVLLAERTLYLPSIGVVLVAGALVDHLLRARQRWTAGIVSIVAALGMIRTFTRVPVFRNDRTFYPTMMRDAPESFRGLWVGGMLAYLLGDRVQGEHLLRAAIATYPLFANVWHDLGRQLQAERRWDEAAQAFTVAFRLDSGRVYDAGNAVSNYVRGGRLDSARSYAATLLEIAPLEPRTKVAMGEIAAAEGRPLEAMTWHRQAAWLDPAEPSYWFRTAGAALDAGYCPELTRSLARLRSLSATFPGLDELEEKARSVKCLMRKESDGG
jgi:protein O-mannosyl-transferase